MKGCSANNYTLSKLENFTHGAPYELLANLRQQQAVSWEEAIDGGTGHWNVFRKADIDWVMKNPELFSNATGPRIQDPPKALIGSEKVSLNMMDPPRHRRNRKLLDQAFKPAAIALREAAIRTIAQEIIDEVIGEGSGQHHCEFVTSVAVQLPLRSICWILGIPKTDRQSVCALTNTMMLADDPDFAGDPAEGFEAQRDLVGYGTQLAADHRVNPRDSLTMDLLNASIAGQGLSDFEYGLFFLNLIIGGIETTRNTAAYGLYEFICHPDQFKILQDNPSQIDDAVEEILRYHAPIVYYRRTATQDTELAGQHISAGDKVIVWLASANRDETVFANPDQFDISRCQREAVRKNSRTFGVGPHFCIGVHLAHLQLRILFEEIIKRMSDIQLVAPPKNASSIFVDGFKEMNISFQVREH